MALGQHVFVIPAANYLDGMLQPGQRIIESRHFFGLALICEISGMQKDVAVGNEASIDMRLKLIVRV